MDGRSIAVKNQMLSDKIGKQEFQQDIAIPLAQPITKSLKETQHAIDKNQDKMIKQLTENQLTIVDTISEIPTRRSAITSSKPKATGSTYVDLDTGLDEELLSKYGYDLPSQLVDRSYDELYEYRENVSKQNKGNG